MLRPILVLAAAGLLLGACQAQKAAVLPQWNDPASWYSPIAPAPVAPKNVESTENAESTEPTDFADHEFTQPLSRETAFRILLNTQIFATGNTGEAAQHHPTQFDAFQILLAQPDAVPVFSDLIRRAHTAGQLYALCGLRLLAPDRYALAEPYYLASKLQVESAQGCLSSPCAVASIVRSSDPATVRLRPDETLDQWEDRALRNGGNTGVVFDIAGGAYPAVFRGNR